MSQVGSSRVCDYTHQGMLILRTPLLPLQSADPKGRPEFEGFMECAEHLIGRGPSENRNLFRQSICIASPHLAQRLETTQSFDEDLEFALWKYQKRASTRTAGFAFFAATSLGRVGELSGYLFDPSTSCWSKASPLIREAKRKSTCLRRNPTLYCTDSEYRYFRKTVQKDTVSFADFQLASIERSEALDQLLQQFAVSRTRKEAAIVIGKAVAMPEEDAKQLLDILLQEQFLIDVASQPALIVPLSSDNRFRQELTAVGADCGLGRYLPPRGGADCVLPERSVLEIASAVESVLKIGQTTDSFCNELETRFIERHGTVVEVPLLRLLDPVDGIFPMDESPLLLALGESSVGSASFSGDDMPMNEWERAGLFRQFDLLANGHEMLRLENLDLDAVRINPRLKLPPLLTVAAGVYSCTNAVEASDPVSEYVVNGVDYTNGLGLLSRSIFSDSRVRELMTGLIGSWSEQIPPNAILAEIVHAPTRKSTQIGMRVSVLSYEIPLFSSGVSEMDKTIECSELTLRHDGHRLQLWCPRLAAEVIPVQTAPLDFESASLPVYRFLCRFQRYRKLAWNLPDVSSRVSPQTAENEHLAVQVWRVPGMRWKNVVLREREWRIKIKAKSAYRSNDDWVAGIRSLCGLPSRVALLLDGGPLELNLDLPIDRKALIKIGKGAEELRFQVGALENRRTTVSWQSGDFQNEFLIPLVRNNMGRDHSVTCATFRQSDSRIRDMHDGWEKHTPEAHEDVLSLHIYAAWNSSDSLIREIGDLVYGIQLKESSRLQGWFFTRFEDPFAHTRIRIVRAGQAAWPDILPELIAGLSELFRKFGVWRVDPEPFEFEHERFGGMAMRDLTLRTFLEHTRVVHAVLSLRESQPGSTFQQLGVAVAIARTIFLQFGCEGSVLYSAVQNLRDWSLRRNSDVDRVEGLLGQLHRMHGRILYFELGSDLRNPQSALIGQVQVLLEPLAQLSAVVRQELMNNKAEVEAVAGRFVHMMLNRLFTSDHRLMEAATLDSLARVLRRSSQEQSDLQSA